MPEGMGEADGQASMLGWAPDERRSPDLLWPRPSHSRGRIGNEHQRTLRWALKPQAGLLALDNHGSAFPPGMSPAVARAIR